MSTNDVLACSQQIAKCRAAGYQLTRKLGLDADDTTVDTLAKL